MSHNAVEIITFHFALSSSPDVSTFADILLQKKRKKVYMFLPTFSELQLRNIAWGQGSP